MLTWMLISLISGWLGSVSVEGIFSRMPKGDLISLEYSESGTMAGYKYYAFVELQENGTVIVKAQKESYGEIIEKKVDAQVLKNIRNIIKEHKMYKYKERYLPPFKVLDGYMWNFHAKFSDGETISSHGSNARPSGDGLNTLKEYMKGLVTDKNKKEEP